MITLGVGSQTFDQSAKPYILCVLKCLPAWLLNQYSIQEGAFQHCVTTVEFPYFLYFQYVDVSKYH